MSRKENGRTCGESLFFFFLFIVCLNQISSINDLGYSLSLSLSLSLSFSNVFFFYIYTKKIQVKNFCGIEGSSTSIGNQLKTVYMRFFQHEKTTTAMLESCTLANPFGKFNTGHFKGVEKVSMSNKRREVRNISQLWTILFLLLTDL